MSKPYLPYATGRLPRIAEAIFRKMFVGIVRRYGPKRGRSVFYATLRSVCPHPPLVKVEGVPFPKRLVEEAVRRGDIVKRVTAPRKAANPVSRRSNAYIPVGGLTPLAAGALGAGAGFVAGRASARRRNAVARWRGPQVTGLSILWSVPNQRWLVTWPASAPVQKRQVLFSGTEKKVIEWLAAFGGSKGGSYRNAPGRPGWPITIPIQWAPTCDACGRTGLPKDEVLCAACKARLFGKKKNPRRRNAVTGPTRMDLQRYYESLRRAGQTHRAAANEVERAFGVSGIQVNASGQIVWFRSQRANPLTPRELRLLERRRKQFMDLAYADKGVAEEYERIGTPEYKRLAAKQKLYANYNGGIADGIAEASQLVRHTAARRPNKPKKSGRKGGGFASHKPGCRCLFHSGDIFKKGRKR
jgi:hypothetical protein